jgi:integral membrane protein
MIRLFRYIGLAEGITTLALFFVAMPAKYWFGYPGLVPTVGLIHGVAFIAYILGMTICLPGRGFAGFDWVRTTLAAFFPFGTFLNDPFLKRKQSAEAASGVV